MLRLEGSERKQEKERSHVNRGSRPKPTTERNQTDLSNFRRTRMRSVDVPHTAPMLPVVVGEVASRSFVRVVLVRSSTSVLVLGRGRSFPFATRRGRCRGGSSSRFILAGDDVDELCFQMKREKERARGSANGRTSLNFHPSPSRREKGLTPG